MFTMTCPTMQTERDLAQLVGIDWGTTHLRAYRIAAGGQVLERRESSAGILTIRNQDFVSALQPLIADWYAHTRPGPTLPMLLCGMVGSRQGWCEVPYRSCPSRISDLASALTAVDSPWGKALFVAGLSTEDKHRRYDVMRGEETQIFGCELSGQRAIIVTPGTHSKWCISKDSTIEHFRTYLTGEMFALLRSHSSIGWLMPDEDRTIQNEASFLDGVRESRREPNLLHSLFSVRSGALFDQRAAEAHSAYLSGLLIGSEVHDALRRYRASMVSVVATASLGRLYEAAILAAGGTAVRRIDAELAVCRGLWNLWETHLKQAKP
ncbi:2-dehydro-3-deoxygalactonokinase [Solimonas terrae]|uniref:2-dehydro-3-deoxygalactonokinase n=1 Tax=Solimonas terrae TaxID=1396819 RepID=A0A6M2BUA1_9GAMM|nr:2-dehydro-3-deoxygalactonokinase [Solimonas terrae]NGY05930.1 2-dehydro-3-deoxygalactonokinase [Solimonas terrae]